MNTISWFVYFAQAIPNLGNLLTIFGIVMTVGWVAFNAVIAIARATHNDFASHYPNDPVKGAYRAHKIEKYGVGVLGATLLFVSVLTPTRDTFYMIAASEMGEKVVTTPEAKEMLGDLREVIAKQIKKLKDTP